jgi:hypothetical protein
LKEILGKTLANHCPLANRLDYANAQNDLVDYKRSGLKNAVLRGMTPCDSTDVAKLSAMKVESSGISKQLVTT